ncbi:MAG: hypothetical protein R3C18_17565 [Planctomycetaceae bacterium]
MSLPVSNTWGSTSIGIASGRGPQAGSGTQHGSVGRRSPGTTSGSTGEFVRGDQKSEDEFQDWRSVGLVQHQRDRRKKNLSPVENGDGHYRPLSMTPIGSSAFCRCGGTNLSIDRSLDLKPVFRDCLNRVTTKEIKAIERAAKKHSPEDLIIWGKDFFKSIRQSPGNSVSDDRKGNRLGEWR